MLPNRFVQFLRVIIRKFNKNVHEETNQKKNKPLQMKNKPFRKKETFRRKQIFRKKQIIFYLLRENFVLWNKYLNLQGLVSAKILHKLWLLIIIW